MNEFSRLSGESNEVAAPAAPQDRACDADAAGPSNRAGGWRLSDEPPAGEEPRPAEVAKRIAALNDEFAKAFVANDGNCSGFVKSVMRDLGYPFPKDLQAAEQVKWLDDKDNGYQVVDAKQAQELADAGYPIVAGYGHHVTLVAPGGMVRGGGFLYVDKAGTVSTANPDQNAMHPRMYGTGSGSWPGVDSFGDKSVRDAFLRKRISTT